MRAATGEPAETRRTAEVWRRTARVYWILPASFVVHDGEELVTMSEWVAEHREKVAELLRAVGLDSSLASVLPSTTTQVAAAVGTVALLFLVVTAAAVRAHGRGVAQWAYAALLGGYFLHIFTHVAQAAAFGGYTPGVVSAVLVSLPASLFVYRHLFQARLLSVPTAVASGLVGLALFLPGVVLAHAVGRLIAR